MDYCLSIYLFFETIGALGGAQFNFLKNKNKNKEKLNLINRAMIQHIAGECLWSKLQNRANL